MKKLHPKQKKLLEILKNNISDPLTLEEMALKADINAPSIVYHHLKQLEKKGFLKRNPYNSRDYQIISNPDDTVVYINLYDNVIYDKNILRLDDKPIDCIPIASKLISFSSEKAFMIRAKDNSMEPKIYEKDLLIAEYSNKPTNYSIVVCLKKNKILIRRYLKYDNIILLQALNEKYPILKIDDIFIIGKVKHIFKSI
jgi:repressor LexA